MEELYLKVLEEEDANELLQFERENRYFSREFNVSEDDTFYTLELQRNIIRGQKRASTRGIRYSFGVFTQKKVLVGIVKLFQVKRDETSSRAWLGYTIGEAFNGKGYATKASELILNFGWNELKLDKVDAGVIPANIGSRRVLEKLGFQRVEGIGENIRINGVWKTYDLYEIINPKKRGNIVA